MKYITRGNLQEVRKQLYRGIPPDVINNYLMIHWAVKSGKPEILRLLLKAGADVNKQDSQGATPLHCAIECDMLEAVKLLLDQAGILLDPKVAKTGWTPLMQACYEGNSNIAALLLAKGADPNVQGRQCSQSLLYVAVANNHADVVKLLLEQEGVEVDRQEKCNGSSPLHRAALHGQLSMIRLLMENGNPNTLLKSKSGETPLQMAERKRHDNAATLMKVLDKKQTFIIGAGALKKLLQVIKV